MRRKALRDKGIQRRASIMARSWGPPVKFDRLSDAAAAAPAFQAFGPAAAARTGTARKRAVFPLRAGAVQGYSPPGNVAGASLKLDVAGLRGVEHRPLPPATLPGLH